MHLDVLDLRNFYYRTQLGRVAQRAIRDQMVQLWPPMAGQAVVGYGFAAPLLRPYLQESRRVIALMPGPQGVMPWPVGMENVAVLCPEARWPIATGFVDRLVMMHGLETATNPDEVMDEAHRTLGPGGRLLVIVPNRAGLWTRGDTTPFGHGHPYSGSQLDAQLRRHGFTPERGQTTLFAPPSTNRFWLQTAHFWENFGRALPWLAGGVLMIEASKQTYAPTRGVVATIARPLRALDGVVAPLPSPKVPQH